MIENELIKYESLLWDGIWDSVGVIYDKGYIVEVVIFLCVLNFDDSVVIKMMVMEFLWFLLCSECLCILNM